MKCADRKAMQMNVQGKRKGKEIVDGPGARGPPGEAEKQPQGRDMWQQPKNRERWKRLIKNDDLAKSGLGRGRRSSADVRALGTHLR